MKCILSLIFLASCAGWAKNTSIDIGAGNQTVDTGTFYGYVGASQYLGKGFSCTVGGWRTVNGDIGPYAGINYSISPFEW